MSIIPRQEISGLDIPNAKDAPSIPTPDISAYPGFEGAKIGAAVSQVGAATATTAARIIQVQQFTAEQDGVTRWLKSNEDAWQSIQSDPTLHEHALSAYTASQDALVADATKGLNPTSAARVQRQIARTQIEYQHRAYNLQRGAILDHTNATADEARQQAVEDGSRLMTSDAAAMEPVDSRRGPVAAVNAGDMEQVTAGGVTPGPQSLPGAADYPGGPVRPDEKGAPAPAGRIEQLAADNVRAGIWTEMQGRQYVEKARHDVANARAINMAVNTPQSLIELGKQEETTPHSTFLSALDPVTRTRVLEMATNRQRANDDAAYTQQERLRVEQHRVAEQSSADVKTWFEQKLADPKQYGALDERDLMLAAELRVFSRPEELGVYNDRMKGQQTQGGVSDPATVKRVQVDMYNSAIPAKDRLADLTAQYRAGKIPYALFNQHAGELSAKVSAEALDKVNPVLKQETVNAQQRINAELRASSILGPGLDDTKNAELSRLSRVLDDNMHAPSPEKPAEIVDRELPGALARVHSGTDSLGSSVATSIRGAMQMPPAESTAKNQASIAAKRAELQRQYQTATTPAQRSTIETQARQLNYLDAIERELDAMRARDLVVTKTTPNMPGGKPAPRSH